MAKIAARDDTPICCKRPMRRVLSAPALPAMGVADHFTVASPVTGRPLHGRSEYLAELKRRNILPESELAGEAEYRKKQKEETERANRRETIRSVIAEKGG